MIVIKIYIINKTETSNRKTIAYRFTIEIHEQILNYSSIDLYKFNEKQYIFTIVLAFRNIAIFSVFLGQVKINRIEVFNKLIFVFLICIFLFCSLYGISSGFWCRWNRKGVTIRSEKEENVDSIPPLIILFKNAKDFH